MVGGPGRCSAAEAGHSQAREAPARRASVSGPDRGSEIECLARCGFDCDEVGISAVNRDDAIFTGRQIDLVAGLGNFLCGGDGRVGAFLAAGWIDNQRLALGGWQRRAVRKEIVSGCRPCLCRVTLKA